MRGGFQKHCARTGGLQPAADRKRRAPAALQLGGRLHRRQRRGRGGAPPRSEPPRLPSASTFTSSPDFPSASRYCSPRHTGAAICARCRASSRRFSAVFLAAFSALSALGMATAPALLRLMHTTPDTIAMAEDYLVIVLAGVPFLALYNVYSAALRGLGDSRGAVLRRPRLVCGERRARPALRRGLPLERRGGRRGYRCRSGRDGSLSYFLRRAQISRPALQFQGQAHRPRRACRGLPSRLSSDRAVQRHVARQPCAPELHERLRYADCRRRHDCLQNRHDHPPADNQPRLGDLYARRAEPRRGRPCAHGAYILRGRGAHGRRSPSL